MNFVNEFMYYRGLAYFFLDASFTLLKWFPLSQTSSAYCSGEAFVLLVQGSCSNCFTASIPRLRFYE